MKRPDEPAFPVQHYGARGLSKREWFAGKLAPALVAALVGKGDRAEVAELIAETSFLFADAMIAEGDKP